MEDNDVHVKCQLQVFRPVTTTGHNRRNCEMLHITDLQQVQLTTSRYQIWQNYLHTIFEGWLVVKCTFILPIEHCNKAYCCSSSSSCCYYILQIFFCQLLLCPPAIAAARGIAISLSTMYTMYWIPVNLHPPSILAGKWRIATKLAHDGLQVSVHPGCAQGQGQGQRSRDTGTFVLARKSLLLARKWTERDQTCTVHTMVSR